MTQVAGFSEYLRQQGLSKRTVTQYTRILHRAEGDVAAWARRQVDSTSPIGTILPLRSAVKHYLTWKGEDPAEIEAKLPSAKGRRPSRKQALSPDQLAAFRTAADAQNEPMRTLMLLLPETGLRIGAMCSLRRDNITKMDGHYVLRFRGKRDTERIVPLTSRARRLLALYIKHQQPERLLWPSPRGGAITPSAVTAAMRRIRDEIGVADLTPHTLRYTFATSLLRKKVPITTVKELMGHKSIRTTANYQVPDMGILADAIEQLEAV